MSRIFPNAKGAEEAQSSQGLVRILSAAFLLYSAWRKLIGAVVTLKMSFASANFADPWRPLR
jgi:hypothetical protein